MTPTHSIYTEAETLVFPDITLKLLLSSKQTNGLQAIFEDLVNPGIGPPRHIHHDQDETFFFLEGQFDVEVAGKLYHMSPGDVAFIPKGTVHAFKNVGEDVGRLRYVFSPALTIEEMFREFHKTMSDDVFSIERTAVIALKHGQEIVGPPL